jgi:hypothetical protein
LASLYATFRDQQAIDDVAEGFETLTPSLRRLVFVNGAQHKPHSREPSPAQKTLSDVVLPLLPRLRHIWLYDLGVDSTTITALRDLQTFRVYTVGREDMLKALSRADMPQLCYVSLADPRCRNPYDERRLGQLQSSIAGTHFAQQCQIATNYFREDKIHRLFASELPRHDE